MPLNWSIIGIDTLWHIGHILTATGASQMSDENSWETALVCIIIGEILTIISRLLERAKNGSYKKQPTTINIL